MKTLARWLFAPSLLLILLATVAPLGAAGNSPGFALRACLICGERGVADAVLNVLLFAPFGVGLALRRGGAYLPALVAGVSVSLGVELAQLWIPGRDPSPGDVLFNSLGTLLGAWVVRSAPRWVDPFPPISRRFAGLAAGAAGTIFVITGVLLSPSLPHAHYFVQWTPRHPHLQPYHGTVRSARWGEVDLAAVEPASVRVREAFLDGAPIHLRISAGPPPSALAAILSIHDDRRREVVLVGADGPDLVLRYRTRSARARFDQPDLHATGILSGIAPGDVLDVRAWRRGSDHCLQAGTRLHCGLGFTLGSGWALLLYVDSLPGPLKQLAGAVWVALLTIPTGYWSRPDRDFARAALFVATALLVLPLLLGLAPTPALETGGAFSGLAIGWALRAAASRGPPAARPPAPFRKAHQPAQPTLRG